MKIYLVGGAVRDKLLGLEPKDNDWVVVGATKDDIKKLLDDGFQQVGADFPVFLNPENNEEWALARVERKTGDGYLGFEVDTEGVTLEQDLARRDLTMNSIAYDQVTHSYIDPYGGITDLLNGVVRHTSPAFSEDPLRVIRVARLAARYNFVICDETRALCTELVSQGRLNELPDSRFYAELEKSMGDDAKYSECPFADCLTYLTEFGVFKHTTYFRQWAKFSELLTWGDAYGISKLSHLSAKERLHMFLGKVGGAGAIKEARIYQILFDGLASTGSDRDTRVNELYQMFGLTHIWSTGAPNYQSLVNVHALAPGKVHSLAALAAVRRFEKIKADQFTETGPALGAAIKSARMQALDETITQVFNDSLTAADVQ